MKPIVSCGVPAALLFFNTSWDFDVPMYYLVTGRDCKESAKMLGDYISAIQKAGLVATSEIYADSSQERNKLIVPTLFHRVFGSDHPDLLADASDFFHKEKYAPGLIVSLPIAVRLTLALVRCGGKVLVVRDRPTAVTSGDLMRALAPFINTYDSTEDPILPLTLVRQMAASVDACVGSRRIKLPDGKTLYVSHADILRKVPEPARLATTSSKVVEARGPRIRIPRSGSHIFYNLGWPPHA